MGEGGDALLLIRFKSEIDRDRDKGDSDENDANHIAQRQAADKPQRQEYRDPNDHLTQIRLHQDEQAGSRDNRSGKQQPQHRMHFAKLGEE